MTTSLIHVMSFSEKLLDSNFSLKRIQLTSSSSNEMTLNNEPDANVEGLMKMNALMSKEMKNGKTVLWGNEPFIS